MAALGFHLAGPARKSKLLGLAVQDVILATSASPMQGEKGKCASVVVAASGSSFLPQRGERIRTGNSGYVIKDTEINPVQTRSSCRFWSEPEFARRMVRLFDERSQGARNPGLRCG